MSFSPGVSDPSGASVIQEQRDRWARKRSRVARELVLTEQRYCQQLELVNTYFVEILKAKETLRPSVVESVFSSIKAIHSVNQSLLVHVENGYLGRGFEQFCPQLPHYNVYVDNMYDARKVLAAQLKKNRGFRRYKALQEARPEFRDCKLEDLLNLPAQRIHQYKHYLQDLTETTSPEDPEFQQLSGAARAVSEVSCRIQDNARSHQNHLQLLRVQRLLKGRRTKVLAPGRWYIREGWLRRVPTKGAEATPRMFFLFSDMLVQAKRCGPPHGGKFSGQHAYPLQDCTVDKVFGHTRSQGGLLSLSFPKAKLLLMSCDQEDINDWHQSLTSAVGKLQSKNTTVHQRDELCRRPLRPAPDPPQNAGPPPATDGPPGRKRNKASCEPTERARTPPTPTTSTTGPAEPKRMKLAGAPAGSVPEPSASNCVIL
ncbi:rho guanine nucleotide exchange factor 39 [Gadus chalcogrammus]|uniref:rho guanine nucleotide exchange factor 39 n=1 Tax=Gadus chalcogrammus TaxID=1042646 RepID=UPI0024C2EF4C|nr:rho guanine nucleotide exchange factor 39 [Gadus chalcogrammus]